MPPATTPGSAPSAPASAPGAAPTAPTAGPGAAPTAPTAGPGAGPTPPASGGRRRQRVVRRTWRVHPLVAGAIVVVTATVAFVAIKVVASHPVAATGPRNHPGGGPSPGSSGVGGGTVGPIVFVKHGAIEEMNPDGTDVHHLVAAGPVPSPGSFVSSCCSDPALSPDGAQLAFVGQGGILELADSNGQHARAITVPSNGFVSKPAWSPSGKQLAFITLSCLDCNVLLEGHPTIDIVDADGSTIRPVVQSDAIADVGVAWSPDGTQLAFATVPRGRAVPSGAIEVLPVSGGRTRAILRGIPGGVSGMSWAPGPLLLFSNLHEPGIFQIDRRGAERRLTNPDIASSPTWSPDGVHFAAIELSGRVVVATVGAGVQAPIGPRGVSDVQWGGGPAPSTSSGASTSAESASGHSPATVGRRV